MNAVQFLLYIFSLVSCITASCKKICVLDDIDCVTAGGSAQFKLLVAGVKGLVDPMDPLYIEGIEDINGSMQYKLSDIELLGLKDCVLTKLMLNVTLDDFKAYFTCPKLITTFNYEANETSCLGDDKVIFTVCDYQILTTGQYGIFVDGSDLMPHFFVKNVLPKVFLKDKFSLKITRRLYATNNNISDEMGEHLLSLIVKKAMRILFHGIDVHARKQALGDIFPGANMKKRKKHCEKT